jgi:hypothetical protein
MLEVDAEDTNVELWFQIVPQHKQHVSQWTVWEPCFPDASFDILLASSGQPGLLTCFFFFFLGGGGLGNFKDKVYMYKHHTLAEMKEYFRDKITVTDKGLF